MSWPGLNKLCSLQEKKMKDVSAIYCYSKNTFTVTQWFWFQFPAGVRLTTVYTASLKLAKIKDWRYGLVRLPHIEFSSRVKLVLQTLS